MKRYGIAGVAVFVGAFCATFLLLIAPTLEERVFVRELETILLPKETATASVLFTGDLMFDRYIRTTLTARGAEHILGGVSGLLAEADMNAGNLEGPITNEPSSSAGTKVGDQYNMRFTFAPLVATLLKERNFGLVSLGNNHMLDFGAEGVVATKRTLDAVDISYIGDPTRQAPDTVIKNVNGIRIGFVAYNQFLGLAPEHTVEGIRTLAAAGVDAVVVMAHWGEEYESAPPAEVRTVAHRFADAGADLIIGTHSHIIGEREDVGNTRIYYSLGNFVFDQYFSPDVKCGLAVKAIFSKKAGATILTYDEVRVGMKENGSTTIGCE